MKILVITQALDTEDSVLSAYHRLVSEIARNFDFVTAICLKKGQNSLPANTKILSLGKEKGGGWMVAHVRYLWRFYKYIFSAEYDVVFVHMNQEYILLGGLLWKMMGKRVYMWRNHHAGSFLTDVAAAFCTKVFCTSKFSYTAKYKKTVLMPVGIETDMFKRNDLSRTAKKPHSILFLARIAPVKKPHLLLEALGLLAQKGLSFTASFYGDALPKDIDYLKGLKEKAKALNLDKQVTFCGGVPNDQTPDVYSAHEVFVNLSSSGMYDKTIFEAMACETLSLASNKNLHGLVPEMFIFEEGNAVDLSQKLEKLLALSSEEKESYGRQLRQIVIDKHSLRGLGLKLAEELCQVK